MKLLKGFSSKSEAEAKSALFYDNPPGAATKYLVGWKKHPEREEWALCVPEDYEEEIPLPERNLLEEDDWPEEPMTK